MINYKKNQILKMENLLDCQVEEDVRKVEDDEYIAELYNRDMESKIHSTIIEFRDDPSLKTSTFSIPMSYEYKVGGTQLSFEEVHRNLKSQHIRNGEFDNPGISPIFENLFKKFQHNLYVKGYFLLQRNDDFTLSIGPPDGYEEEPMLDHKYNKVWIWNLGVGTYLVIKYLDEQDLIGFESVLMNIKTTKEMFQIANIDCSDLYIKYLLSFTGANGCKYLAPYPKVEDFNINECISTGYIRLTKNNYLLLNLDLEELEAFEDSTSPKFSEFTYNFLCVDYDGIFNKSVDNKVPTINNIIEECKGYRLMIMIDGTTG